jgi:hypothetical protein
MLQLTRLAPKLLQHRGILVRSVRGIADAEKSIQAVHTQV